MKISHSKDPEYKNFEKERNQKGIGRFIMHHNFKILIAANHLIEIPENCFWFINCERSVTEKSDLDIIDDGVKSISDFGKDDLMPHLIYCGYYYFEEKEWNDFDKNEKIWNSIINTDNPGHEETESSD